MENMNESEVKYLAGLLDADGTLSFKFCKTETGKTYCYLVLALTAVQHIDRQDYVKSLARFGGQTFQYVNGAGNPSNKWNVQSRRDLNKILPRIIKHMVIKGKHWQNLYDKYNELKGEDCTQWVEALKVFSEESRKEAGPVRPKNHPTWPWVAGYLDGDGCYTFSHKHRKNTLHVGAIAHYKDVVALELLQKAFGGTLYDKRDDNTRLWRRGLGKSQRAFALSFLRKVHRHSRLKKYKIERMLEFHKASRND